MKVWIDLSNSPHPLLFAPVTRRLRELGHDVVLTARDNAQTVQLSRSLGLDAEVVGDESPKRRVLKAAAITRRAAALRAFARRTRPDVALSHNSYAQLAAARMLGIRSVTAMDFEFQPSNHVAFRLADTILLPDAIDASEVRSQGATSNKLRYYPGYKEQLYLGDFEPDPDVLGGIGIRRLPETVIVVTRTPPTRALYHHGENDLYVDALRALGSQPHVRCVALVRHAEQRAVLERLGAPNMMILDRAVDARSLMYVADLVLGGGGTMTREAALLGVPTYSVFAGRRPAVDRALERSGALRWLVSASELSQVGQRPRAPVPIAELRVRGRAPLQVFIDATVSAARPRRSVGPG